MSHGGHPYILGRKHDPFREDHGYQVRKIGDMEPIIGDARTASHVSLSTALVNCWCERTSGYVSMNDIAQGRTWTCGRRSCAGDSPNAELQPRPFDRKHGPVAQATYQAITTRDTAKP
jgi:hypothetical protein